MLEHVYIAEKLRDLEAPRLERRWQQIMEVRRLYPKRPLLGRLGAALVRTGERLQRWSYAREPWQHSRNEEPSTFATAND